MAKKILTTPIQKSDLEGIKLGDVIYLTGHITTSRDMSHRRGNLVFDKDGNCTVKSHKGVTL